MKPHLQSDLAGSFAHTIEPIVVHDFDVPDVQSVAVVAIGAAKYICRRAGTLMKPVKAKS